MTQPLTTPYHVGDVVLLTQDDPDYESLRADDVGVIREIFISCPDDGDETVLLFDVLWSDYGKQTSHDEGALKLVTKTSASGARALETRVSRRQRPGRQAQAWLRRQLSTLDTNEGGA